MNIIFDIDGVLADNRHRRSLIEAPPKDWDTYYDRMGADPVIQPVADIMATMAMTNNIFLCTGRPTQYRQRTNNWLKAAELWDHVYRMFMRPEGDRRPNPDLKRDMAEAITMEYGPIYMVFEDDPRSVKVWKEYAHTVLEVSHVGL